MIELFNTYVNWKILGYFLSHPGSLSYASEIAKKLSVSPSSANNAVKYFADKGYLKKEQKGFATLYRLNMDNCIVVALKKAYGLDFIFSAKPLEIFLNADPKIISLALYGSYANGTFDERSDIDFLIITETDRQIIMKPIRDLENKLGKEVNVTIFKLTDWRTLADNEDAFYKNIVANHISIYGSGLE